MIRTSSLAAKAFSFALVLGAAAFTSTSAYALPHFGVHRHIADPNDTRVSFTILNKSEGFRDVKVDGHVYTILSHQALAIKAPEGTGVYADTTAALHRKGDLLISVSRSLQNTTVSID